jgi:hypothetical protein
MLLQGRQYILPQEEANRLAKGIDDQRGAIVLRQKWSRRQIEARLAN